MLVSRLVGAAAGSGGFLGNEFCINAVDDKRLSRREAEPESLFFCWCDHDMRNRNFDFTKSRLQGLLLDPDEGDYDQDDWQQENGRHANDNKKYP